MLIIVPAYNEASIIDRTLIDLLRYLKKQPYNSQVLVVDDGSQDGTYQRASQHPVSITRHLLNRGLGGALGTGLAYARQHLPDVTITFDADGQHLPSDIPKLVNQITRQHKDFVIGSRLLGEEGMHWDRKLLNQLANMLTLMVFGYPTSDSQSGLRAFSKTAIQKIVLKTQRMEVSSEFFLQARKHKLQYGEVSIKPIYTQYSRAKGQDGKGNLNSFSILSKMLIRLIR